MGAMNIVHIEVEEAFIRIISARRAEPQECLCRLNIDPPCRLNIDPGLVANFRIGNCG